MPKRIAVIDLGSNSARMAIFERTSRLGFFILREYKLKVRLGEGAYEKGGVLQQKAMDNVYSAFSEFKSYIKLYGARRIIATGTSALRDAPNAKEFINRVKNGLGINLRVVDGKSEAYYGGLAALNLLSPLKNATTIDIGGGSTELARIQNGRITATISLNIGTVRLKELFYDKKDANGASEFINKLLKGIDKDFANSDIIAIGGSLRAISTAIIKERKYPLESVHNFIYPFNAQNSAYIRKIALSSVLGLKNFNISKDRFDTIRGGALVFLKLCESLGAKRVITSGVGIREGLLLSAILRPGVKFPANFNPSLKSLQDRFCPIDNRATLNTAKELFRVFAPFHRLGENELFLLSVAAKIFNVGRALGYYKERLNSAYIVRTALNYGYTHEQLCNIAVICQFHGKDFDNDDLGEFSKLCAPLKTLKWLCFLLASARELSTFKQARFSLDGSTLKISGLSDHLMLKKSLKKLPKPATIAISFED